MDAYHIVNGISSLGAAIALGHVVLSRDWVEGLIAKVGMIVMILSLSATAMLTLSGIYNWEALSNADTALRAGVMLVVTGLYFRHRDKYHPRRRKTDWAELDSE